MNQERQSDSGNGLQFEWTRVASGDAPASGAALAERNPFHTCEYLQARARCGSDVLTISLRRDGVLESGCPAFLRSGRLNRSLEIPSLPPADGAFWTGLIALCRELGVTDLSLGTFASQPVQIPAIGTRLQRVERCEWVLQLPRDASEAALDRRHRYSVRKARENGVAVRRADGAGAVDDHLRVMSASVERRRARGDASPGEDPSAAEVRSLVESGAGEIYQAILDGSVVASGLVLRAPRAAYYHTSGSTPEGLAARAVPLLIHEITLTLAAQGVEVFNLGGALPESPLGLFKRCFGASPVALEAATAYVGPEWRRRLTSAVQMLHSRRGELRRLIVGRLTRYFVFSQDLHRPVPVDSVEGAEFRKLDEVDLRAIADPAFRDKQIDRLARFGTNYAYGVVVDRRIAHISWLLPPAAIRIETPAVLLPVDGDAEITACETLPEYRGRGLYPFAIGELLNVAHAQGVRRVFMKTHRHNAASQAGIRKAGLRLSGTAMVYEPPVASHRAMVWRRF